MTRQFLSARELLGGKFLAVKQQVVSEGKPTELRMAILNPDLTVYKEFTGDAATKDFSLELITLGRQIDDAARDDADSLLREMHGISANPGQEKEATAAAKQKQDQVSAAKQKQDAAAVKPDVAGK
jgi:hypothetical protein